MKLFKLETTFSPHHNLIYTVIDMSDARTLIIVHQLKINHFRSITSCTTYEYCGFFESSSVAAGLRTKAPLLQEGSRERIYRQGLLDHSHVQQRTSSGNSRLRWHNYKIEEMKFESRTLNLHLELYQIRYSFMPNRIQIAMNMPDSIFLRL